MLKLKLRYFGCVMWRADSLERPWCWERLRAGGERDDRRWDGWMASPIRLAWVWASSRKWWRTGRPGVLQSMGSDTTERQYERNDFHEPRLLHLPVHRKELNSLTWNVWFPLINSNILMFRLPAFCFKTSEWPGAFPQLHRAALSGFLEMLPPGLKS